jgi:hypothetical protein
VQANLVVEGDPPIGSLPAAAARESLHGCATDEQAAWAAARRRPQAVAPFAQPVQITPAQADAFAALPRSYVMCLRDRAIPPPMQRRMLESVSCDPVLELDTDHCPWISRTNELVAALDQLVAGR